MKKLPKKLNGDHDLVPWLNYLLDCIRERTPMRGAECEIDFLPDGFRPKPKPPNPSGVAGDTTVAAPLNMVLRGEHNNALNYSPGDVVKKMNGDNGGAFVALVPIPAGSSEEPGEGVSWDRLSSFTFGQWT